ncbi:hypothetical protein BSKO_10666 [Bryopsis sp. KO-2023]|nr:hypothetical protein BSKO_10666 [Bryopsis sp. KO-2023]
MERALVKSRTRLCVAFHDTSSAKPTRRAVRGGTANPYRLKSQPSTTRRQVEVPLRTGVKNLSQAESLIGWSVFIKANGELIGTVDDVLEVSLDNLYMKVVEANNPSKTRSKPTPPTHLIPLVPDIVPSIVFGAKKVFLTPPDGLLDLGRSNAEIEALGIKLSSFARALNGGFAERLGLKCMPSQKELEEVGRKDLVQEVIKAGGFAVVAENLGWKANRRPTGHWDEAGVLDEEIAFFVASCWEEMQTDDKIKFYYNKVSKRVSWDLPSLPEKIPLDDFGNTVFVEDESQRYMPTKKDVCAGGRYDLHHAICFHGGYKAVASGLDRKRAIRGSCPNVKDRISDLKTVHSFLEAHSLQQLPTRSFLLKQKRPEVWKVIRRYGVKMVAAHLGVSPPCTDPIVKDKAPPRKWKSVEEFLHEFRSFCRSNSFVTSEGEQRMPTHSELIEMGRYDLLYQLTKLGSDHVAERIGVRANSAGRKGKSSEQHGGGNG